MERMRLNSCHRITRNQRAKFQPHTVKQAEKIRRIDAADSEIVESDVNVGHEYCETERQTAADQSGRQVRAVNASLRHQQSQRQGDTAEIVAQRIQISTKHNAALTAELGLH